MTESTANAEQKHKEEDARALAMHQAEEERIMRRVQKMGEEETGKFEKMEEAVVALKKQVVEENSKGLKLEEEVRVLKKAVDEEKNKAMTLEEEVAALKKTVEEEKRKTAKLEEEVATLRKALDEANAMAEKEKEGTGGEREVVAALKKAVEKGNIEAVTLAQEVAALRKALDEANAMVQKEKEGSGGEREMLAALKEAVEEEKGTAAKFEEEVVAPKKAVEEDSTENTRKDNQDQERASAADMLTEQNGTGRKTRAPTKQQATGTEGRQVPDEHDLAFRYPFQVWHNGVRVRVAMCVPGAELWCDRAQYKVRGLPASLEHTLLFQLPCRLSAPVSFTLDSPAEVVLFFVAAPRDGELPHKLVSEGWTLQSIFSRFDWDGPGTDKEQDRFVTTASKTYAGPVSYTLPAHAGETVMGLCIRPLDHSLEQRLVEVNTASVAPPQDSNASAVGRLQSDAATEKIEQSVASLSVEHGKSELGTNHCAVCLAMATVASIEKTARDRTREEGQVHTDGGGTETKMRWTERLGIGFEPGVGSTSEQFQRCLTMAVEVEVLAELESLRAQIANLKSALGVGESDLMASLEAIQAENARLRHETVHLREALSVREREHKTALKRIRYTASCVDMSTRNRACLMRFRTRQCCVSALTYVRVCAGTRTMMPQRLSGRQTGGRWKSCSAR